jgi:hypothetical protein
MCIMFLLIFYPQNQFSHYKFVQACDIIGVGAHSRNGHSLLLLRKPYLQHQSKEPLTQSESDLILNKQRPFSVEVLVLLG